MKRRRIRWGMVAWFLFVAFGAIGIMAILARTVGATAGQPLCWDDGCDRCDQWNIRGMVFTQ